MRMQWWSRKAERVEHDPSRHYPNKAEAECLRRLMSTTGLTEEQLRADIKYRRMLSAAQKEGQKAKRTPQQKFYAKLVKEACRTTKLAKEHPETLTVLQKIIDEPSWWRSREMARLGIDHKTLTAEAVLNGT